jgi:hypothetical protein
MTSATSLDNRTMGQRNDYYVAFSSVGSLLDNLQNCNVHRGVFVNIMD